MFLYAMSSDVASVAVPQIQGTTPLSTACKDTGSNKNQPITPGWAMDF